MKRNINIEILWGLPGSGKTHYANQKENSEDESSITETINVDEISDKIKKKLEKDSFKNYKSLKMKIFLEFRNSLLKIIEGFYAKDLTIIIDSLITNNSIAEKVLNEIDSVFKEFNVTAKKTIIFWIEDRESCVFNDEGRRIESSAFVIKSMKYERPSEELIRKFNLSIKEMKVMKKDPFEIFCKKYNIGNKIESNRWTIGGMTGGDCWGGEPDQSVSADPQPDFEELDKILEQICPNLSFLQYKGILRECVTVEDDCNPEYYGNYREYAYYVCDVKSLYNYLISQNII